MTAWRKGRVQARVLLKGYALAIVTRVDVQTASIGDRAASAAHVKEDIMVRFALFVRSLLRRQDGQDLLEYALLVALIAVGAVAAVGLAGDEVVAVFNDIVAKIPGGQ